MWHRLTDCRARMNRCPPSFNVYGVLREAVPIANPILRLPARGKKSKCLRVSGRGLKDSGQIARLSGHTTIPTRPPAVERAIRSRVELFAGPDVRRCDPTVQAARRSYR